MASQEFTDRERAVIEALVETFAPPDCDRATACSAVVEAFGRLAPHRRAKLRTLLGLLAGPILSFVLIGRFVSFAQLNQSSRERLLCAMADSPIALLRTGFQAFKRLCAFVAYAAVDAAGRNPLWAPAGYPGPRHEQAPAWDPLPLLDPRADTLDAEVVVVGSGAGGGVAAALFAQAGRRVVVLEMGPLADQTSFAQREADAFAALYLDSALTSTEDLGISILAGSCVGGGTTINWCTSLRLPDIVAGQWCAVSGGIDFGVDLAPHYDSVSARIGVQTTSDHNGNNSALLRGCRALGWRVTESPRNASGCGEGCGYCGFGCAYHNKRSTTETYLRDAVAAGAWVVAGARVDRISIENGRATGVDAILSGGRPLRVRASTVVVAAGSLRTPQILRTSGMRSPHLGRHLKLHPTTAIFAEFDEPVETWHGPMQSIMSDQFGDIDDGYGARFEAAPAHPGLSAIAVPWRSQTQHRAIMLRGRNAAGLIVLTRDRGEGRVSLEGRSDVHYELAAYDARHMLAALAGLVEAAFAAGARGVVTLHAIPMELTRERASKENIEALGRAICARGAAPNRIGVFSAHQMGTCRMSRSPARGVVDEHGSVHGVDGLIVADASVFPLSSGVNPMLTIMALAHRTASHYAAK